MQLSLTKSVIENAGKDAVTAVESVLSEDLEKVILYGSCARGTYDDDSDIDIALITKCNRIEAKKYDDALARISTELAVKYFVIVNFVSIPENEFQEKKGWYKYFENIDAEGVLLYG